MAAKPTDAQSGQSKLFLFINDFTDSDNEASAEVWAWMLEQNPQYKGAYVAEPRWVDLGHYMGSADFGRCIGTVGKLDPPLEDGEPPLTTVLAGRMTQEIIDSRRLIDSSQVEGRPLNEVERNLVSRFYDRCRIIPWCLLGSNQIDSSCAVSSQTCLRKQRTTQSSMRNSLLWTT